MKHKTNQRFRQLVLTHLRQAWGGLLLAGLCTLGYTLAELLAPWPLKLVFDHVLLNQPLPAALADFEAVWQHGKGFVIGALSAAILLIAASKGLFAYTQLYLTARIGFQFVHTLRRELFAHLQQLSLSFHQRAKSGELLTKVTSDTNTLKDVCSEAALSFVAQLLTLTGMCAVLLWLNWRLSLIVFITLPLLGYTIFAIYRRVKVSARAQREREGRIASRISESLGSILLVRAFARERFEQERFDDESEQNLTESIRTARADAAASRAVELINAVGICAAVLFGARQVIAGAMTPGDVLIFTAYLSNMYKPLRNLAKLATQFSRAQVSAERISQILAIEAEDDDRHGLAITKLAGEITFQQVTFAYDNAHPVLRNASFVIEAGQRVALVGASGAGKSTIANLILRFYTPQSGDVLIDGLNAAVIQRQSLRREIGVVLQDNILFGASIRENISYGKPEAKREAIERAAQLAYAHDFIAALPDGYDTIIGERGSTLSGGQRQRLCLARALLKQPSILILDEPTAAVDAESAVLIERAIAQQQRGKTTIVISHQFNAMESYDQIIVLRGGAVVEIGTHAQLLARRGYYFELHRLQGRGENNTAALPLLPTLSRLDAQSNQSAAAPLRITQFMDGLSRAH